MVNENFMSIAPRSKNFLGLNMSGIPLMVIQADGVDFKPSVKFAEADLDDGSRFFQNLSGKCDSFTIKCLVDTRIKYTVTKQTKVDTSSANVIIEANLNNPSFSYEVEDTVTTTKDYRVDEVLDYYIKNAEPFYITSRAVGINDTNQLWLVTENPSRKQYYENGYVEWELTFTKYTEITSLTFKKSSAGVENAKKKYDTKKAKAKSTAKTKLTAQNNLKKKCKASNLKYSKTKKVVTCVKYMQQVLSKVGCYDTKKNKVDGWYGNATKTAVKAFQKKYHTKYKLKQTGNVDSATFKALYSVNTSTTKSKPKIKIVSNQKGIIK